MTIAWVLFIVACLLGTALIGYVLATKHDDFRSVAITGGAMPIVFAIWFAVLGVQPPLAVPIFFIIWTMLVALFIWWDQGMDWRPKDAQEKFSLEK